MHAILRMLPARIPRPPNICPWMNCGFAEFSDSWQSFFTPGIRRLRQGHEKHLPDTEERTGELFETGTAVSGPGTRRRHGKNGAWTDNSPVSGRGHGLQKSLQVYRNEASTPG